METVSHRFTNKNQRTEAVPVANVVLFTRDMLVQQRCRSVFKYGKLSHFAKVCRSKPKNVLEISANMTQSNTQSFLTGSVHVNDEPYGGWILMYTGGRLTLTMTLGLTLTLSARALGLPWVDQLYVLRQL